MNQENRTIPTLKVITGICYAAAWMLVIEAFWADQQQFLRKWFGQD